MKTNILTLAITLTVGIILAGSLLMPVISDSQKSLGTPVEIANSTYNGYVGTYDIMDGFTITDSNVVNGEALVDTATTANRLVFADTFYVTYRSTGAWQIISADGVESGSDTLACTASNGTATFTSTSLGSKEYTYSIAYVFSGTDGEYIINSSFTHSKTIFVSDINKVFLSTNQTVDGTSYFVTIRDGKVTSGSTEGTLTYTAVEVADTKGVEEITALTANINGADVNLAILLVPASETGYESNANTILVGVLPILVIVGLLIASIAVVRVKD